MRPNLSRLRLFWIWLGLGPVLVVLWYFPIIDFPVRVLTWIVGIFLLIGGLLFAWRFPVVRWFLLGLYALGALFVIWPSHRPLNTATLRMQYCEALKSYLGCRYIWGGESYTGIDCSGFVRKGLEDALVERGICSLNPNALRQGISLYWHDTNARAIGEGYMGRTKFVTKCSNLNVLDYSLLHPGDMAVTTGGDHVMAYLGDKTWIAADPGPGRVTEFHIPEKTDPYFSTGMNIVRWRILSD